VLLTLVCIGTITGSCAVARQPRHAEPTSQASAPLKSSSLTTMSTSNGFTRPTQSSSLATLPQELQDKILHYADGNDLFALSQTCIALRATSRPFLFQEIIVNFKSLRPELLASAWPQACGKKETAVVRRERYVCDTKNWNTDGGLRLTRFRRTKRLDIGVTRKP